MRAKIYWFSWVLIGLLMALGPYSTAQTNVDFDLCEAIDTSGSISADQLALEVQGFKEAFNRVLLPAVAAGATIDLAIVGFATNVQTFLPLTPVTQGNKATIEAAYDAVQNTTDRGRTNMGGAINQCASILAGGTATRKVINLSTDGRPNIGPPATDAATNAKNAGIEIWTLGVGPNADNALLSQIAGCPPARPDCGAKNFPVTSFDNFVQAIREKAETIIGPANRPPIAAADSTTTTPGTPVVISVLNNDSDPDGDPLTVTSIAQPANGTAVINPDGTITYTPNPGFVGTDTFTYTISDGRGGTATATITVTVSAAPPGPPPPGPPPPGPPPPAPPVGIPELSPPWLAILALLLSLLLIRKLYQRSAFRTRQ